MSLKQNIYRHVFSAKCPNDGELITYKLEIKTAETIMVERIKIFTWAINIGYHEQLADELHREFGGEQRMVAFHQDAEIETVRMLE
ncbi:hypothetical protein D9M68_938490 [compost metagenome]